jgi:uncharacterized membrane protein YeiH
MHINAKILLTIAVFAGTSFFAATGVLASSRRRMDWIGAVVLAVVTAVGGGTLRDILSGQLPVFWIYDPLYLWVAITTAIIILPLMPLIRFPEQALLLPDACGLALSTWIGCEKVFLLGLPGIDVVILGVMTGTAGGIIRDILSAQIPNLLRRGELYAGASIPGALAFVVIRENHLSQKLAAITCITIVLVLRLAALRWKIMLPNAGDAARIYSELFRRK